MVEYSRRQATLPAFDLVGFTKIVSSGGEQFEEVWGDGRWQQLRQLGGADPTIYGAASYDAECPEGRYRYTLAVKPPAEPHDAAGLFSLRIPASEWIVFTVNFAGSFGQLWQDDPYKVIGQLGWEFNRTVGLHLDVYPPSYVAREDDFEFWMPVVRRV